MKHTSAIGPEAVIGDWVGIGGRLAGKTAVDAQICNEELREVIQKKLSV